MSVVAIGGKGTDTSVKNTLVKAEVQLPMC